MLQLHAMHAVILASLMNREFFVNLIGKFLKNTGQEKGVLIKREPRTYLFRPGSTVMRKGEYIRQSKWVFYKEKIKL